MLHYTNFNMKECYHSYLIGKILDGISINKDKVAAKHEHIPEIIKSAR